MAAEQKLIMRTPGCSTTQFNQHGKCTTAIACTVAFDKFQAACISKITDFLPSILMCKTEYHRGCCRCFTASDVKCSHSI